MNRINGDPVLDVIVCHDDSLIFRGQKHEIDLDADWYKVMPKDGKITGYRKEREPLEMRNGWAVCDWIKPEEYENMGMLERMQWRPVSGRQALLENGVTMHAKDSYIDVRMNNLWENFGTRYRATLDALVLATDRGVLAYNPKPLNENTIRVRTPEEKKIEAVRVKFRKYWHAVTYEHNLVLPLDIGLVLLDELKGRDQAGGKYAGTVYLKGWKAGKESKGTIKVKVYDMRGRHEYEGVKIEVTLRQDYLERHGMKDPNTWETQPEIQKKIQSTLEREWSKVIGNGGARDMLKERLNCKQSELFHFMGETRNTLTEVKERLSAVERLASDTAKLASDTAKRLDALESKERERR